jgi:polysaccharide biosynthesis transport protein
MKDTISKFPQNRLISSQESALTTTNSRIHQPSQHEAMNLGFVLTSLRKYWYATILLSSVLMTGIIYKTSKEPRIYKSGIQIAIELNNNSSLAEKLTATTTGGSSLGSDTRSTTLETTIQKLKSKTIVKKAIDSIADPKLRPSVDTFLQNLTIQTGQNTNILTITYTDTVPQRIVANLNALSKTYIEYGIKTKKAHTDNSIAFIESQLPKSRERLKISSKELEKFRQKYRFIDSDISAKGLADYQQDILKRINDNKIKYNETKQQDKELKKQLIKVGLQSGETLSTTMLTQDSAYQELFKKLNDLEMTYSQEKLRLTDNNPILINVKEKRDEALLLLKNRAQQVLKKEVSNADLTNGVIANFGNNLAQNLANKQAEIETSLAAQTAQYESLNRVSQQIEKQISQLPTLQQQYTDLQRQYNIYSHELTAFLQKLQELRIADAEQVVPWTLLDPPELPQIPIFPNVGQQLGLGAIGSLFAGVLAAIGLHKLKNNLNNRVDNLDTLKAITGMPMLTLIPKVTDFDRVAMRGGNVISTTKNNNKNNSYWSFIEAMRMLVLDIGLVTDDEKDRLGKVIAMTSAVPKEGKSTISFHTSITLAELGYRVLLVDVDLHRSTIPKLCQSSPLFESVDCSNESGLSDVLLKGDNWKNLIKKSPQLRLEVLFPGQLSVNSISLINSPRFKRLIDLWKQEYDYVIFDTPPIVGVSDTRLISTLVDGLVYIVSLNVAQRKTIDRAVDIISSLKTPVLGLVINRVEEQDSGYHEHYKYYHESHGRQELHSNLARIIDHT